MGATWKAGAPGRVVRVEGNMAGCNFEAFSLNGGELFLPEDTRPFPGEGDPLGRPMVPGLQLQGPCVLIYLDGADAARFRSMFGLPAPNEIAPMVGNGGGLILPGG